MKRILFTALLILSAIGISAVPADPTPGIFVQPNGDTITIYLRGDEYAHWYETSGGAIVMDNGSGTLVYAETENGKVVPSSRVVGQSANDCKSRACLSSGDLVQRTSITNIYALQRRTAIEEDNRISTSYDMSDPETKAAVDAGEIQKCVRKEFGGKFQGDIKILTILVQFPDLKFQDQANVKSYFNDMFNKHDFIAQGDNTPTGSVNDYWREVSYGKVNMTSDVVGPYTAHRERKFYGSGENNVNTRQLARFAIIEAAKEVNMAKYDNNNDGYVDGVNIVFAGIGQEQIGKGNGIVDEYIWAHQWSVALIFKDGVGITNYCMSPERVTKRHNGNVIYDKYCHKGTMCHELAHVFGAPDFYDVDYGESDGEFAGTGYYDLMGSGNWNNDKKSPAHPNPWLKLYLWRWSQYKDLAGTNRLYTILPTETHNNEIYRFETGNGDFYLMENKQQAYLPGKGLIIYHVHADMSKLGLNELANSPDLNVKHPQLFYVVAPDCSAYIPTKDPNSYGSAHRNCSFSDRYSGQPFFTSYTTPSNRGWNGTPLSSPKDITMISETEEKGETVVKFVLNPMIEGNTKFCDGETYSLNYIPPYATVDWSYVNKSDPIIASHGFDIYTDGKSQATYNRQGYFTSNPSTGESVPNVIHGDQTLTANIEIANEVYSINKDVFLPNFIKLKVEDKSYLSPTFQYWLVGATKQLTASNIISSASNVKWIISGSSMKSAKVLTGETVSITPEQPGSLKIQVIDEGGCSPYNEVTINPILYNLAPVVHPNPATGTTNVNVIIERGDTEDRTLSFIEYQNSYTLELWHQIYGIVKRVDVPENTPSTQLDLTGLAPDTYILRIIINESIVSTTQVIVQ